VTFDEARLHAWIATWARPAPLVGSSGHDAAVLAPTSGRPVYCTDQTVLGVHVEVDVAPRRFGAKAVARTISDLAATAARPHATLLALRAPKESSATWLRAVLDGARRRAEALGAPVVAGDLTCAPGPAQLSVTALGTLPGRRTPPGRDRARAGQVLVLTGPCGGSRARRHLVIEPRLAAGEALWRAGATALMDVSDGLGLDADRLARASGVRLVLERVPIHRDARAAARASGREPLDHALEDGEDHELLATLPVAAARRLLRDGLPGAPAAAVVGRVEGARRAQVGLWLDLAAPEECSDERARAPVRWRGRGWIHGASDADRSHPNG
jgi:thiamine-monophosphate kinase